MTSAGCAMLASVLASAAPGDTVKLAEDCGDTVVVRNVAVAAPGVVVDATGRTFANGIRLLNVQGVTFRGGTYRKDRPDPRSYAAEIRGGGALLFDGATFTGAARGMVIGATQGITVRNSRFIGLESDGIDIAGKGDNGLIENNRFADFKPALATCTLADGAKLNMVGRGKCSGMGGSWRDGQHPDAIQTWGGWGTLVARNNIIENMDGSPAMTMGITTHGKGPPQRFDIEGNRLHLAFSAGIANVSQSGKVTGNVLRGDGTRRTGIRVGPGVTACGNKIADIPSSAATRPC
jgi:hypothetical protein